MQNFSEWAAYKDACTGYALASLARTSEENLTEGRREPEKLRSRGGAAVNRSLFDRDRDQDDLKKGIVDPAAKAGEDMVCPITPLSGYEHHIKAIQQFAFASPANFAQTLLFSPLSANVPFPKHWDNFQLLMMILKHSYPDRVSEEELEHVIDSFGEYLHSMAHTIGGWKIQTVCQVWNNKETMMHKLIALSKKGNDAAMIRELIKIPGVQPVKAGFIVQLLFGRAGCIDTHNIDIYSKAFPDLATDLQNPGEWQGEKGVPKYMKLLKSLNKRGIGTKELWDVWVDFVENFYRQISSHGLGSYTDMGTAIDNPDDPKYDALKKSSIPKMGATAGGKLVSINPISGKMGRGASATHLQMDPDDALYQFDKIYSQGEAGSAAARAVPFRTNQLGQPIDRGVGLGDKPSLLHYFKPALAGKEVDPEVVRAIIRNRMNKGGKKAVAAKARAAQSTFDF
jgi:hypothetical protein